MSPAVAVDALVVGYGPVTAVDRVTFDVAPGEHLTLLGPSGCGKTTTLRALAGLERPKSGRISIGGRQMFGDGAATPPEARGLSMVFQSYAIWPHMTVAENVGFPFRARGIGKREAQEGVRRALALVGLADYAERPATRLSGGQQQRVALARAVAFGTELVLFDEPLSNLDAQLRVQMRAELLDLRRRLGFAAVYVTHDQDEAFSLSDRILLMRGGRVEQEGTPAALYRAPRTRFAAAFLGMRNVHDAQIDRGEALLADGSVLRVEDDGPPGPAAVAFRPHAVRLGAGAAATVTSAQFGGERTLLTLAAGPIIIHAEVPPETGLEAGATVRWHVPPEACRVLRE